MSIEDEHKGVDYAVGYTPTDVELEMLKDAGLTLEQALQYNKPSEEEWKSLRNLGFGLVEAILSMGNLKVNILDSLTQAQRWATVKDVDGKLDEKVSVAHEQAVRVITKWLQGNPYPGKDFSIEQGKTVLTALKKQTWQPATLVESITSLREIITPPKKK